LLLARFPAWVRGNSGLGGPGTVNGEEQEKGEGDQEDLHWRGHKKRDFCPEPRR